LLNHEGVWARLIGFWVKKTAGFCEWARIIATWTLFTLTECWNLDGQLGKGQDKMDCWDSSGWGLEHGGTAKLVEERCLIFLKNRCVWKILPRFLNVPGIS